jgi:hypothetical protein
MNITWHAARDTSPIVCYPCGWRQQLLPRAIAFRCRANRSLPASPLMSPMSFYLLQDLWCIRHVIKYAVEDFVSSLRIGKKARCWCASHWFSDITRPQPRSSALQTSASFSFTFDSPSVWTRTRQKRDSARLRASVWTSSDATDVGRSPVEDSLIVRRARHSTQSRDIWR